MNPLAVHTCMYITASNFFDKHWFCIWAETSSNPECSSILSIHFDRVYIIYIQIDRESKLVGRVG